jgi:hypothetical protein
MLPEDCQRRQERHTTKLKDTPLFARNKSSGALVSTEKNIDVTSSLSMISAAFKDTIKGSPNTQKEYRR